MNISSRFSQLIFILLLAPLSAMAQGNITVGTIFGGMDGIQDDSANIGVGPNYVCQGVEGAFTFFTKSGQATEWDTTMASIANSGGANQTIVYDPTDQRWVVCAGVSTVYFAVSNTSDPTQGWSERLTLDFPLSWDGGRFAYNASAYFVMYSAGGDPDMIVIDKSSILSGSNSPATTYSYNTPAFNSSLGSSAVLMEDDTTVNNPGDPMWFYNQNNLFKATNYLSNSPTYTTIALTGTMARGKYAEVRNGNLVTIDDLGPAYWSVTNLATATVTQSGTIEPPSGYAFTNYTYSSLAANGDIGITYLAETADYEQLAMFITGRAASDPPGTMRPSVMVAHGSAGGRIGDYASIFSDPATGTFWAINAPDIGRGSNAIVNFGVSNTPVAPLSPVTGLGALPSSGTNVTVQWNTVPGATSYQLLSSTDNVTFTTVATLSGTATSYTDTPAAPVAGRYYDVVAYSGTTTNSTAFQAVVTTLAPTPPTYDGQSAPGGLTAVLSGTAGNGIQLSWNNVSGEDGFSIQRASSGSTWTQVATTGSNVLQYTDTNAPGSNLYFYRVSTMNASGSQSVPSSVVSITNRPSAPAVYLCPVFYYNQVEIAWLPNLSATGYTISRSTDDVNFTVVGTTPANYNTFTDNPLTPGTTYYYSVVANGLAGPSLSGTVSARPAVVAPEGHVTIASGTNFLTSYWNVVNGAINYQVLRSTDAVNFSPYGTAPLNYYTDTNVTPLQQYYYEVVTDGSGAGDTSGTSTVAFGAVSTPVPSPWMQQPIGFESLDGFAAPAGGYNASTNAFSLIGYGGDIGGAWDVLYYIYQKLGGDGMIQARVPYQQATGIPKTGVMIRDGGGGSVFSGGTCAHVFALVNNGLDYEENRTVNGAGTNIVAGPAGDKWVKLIRHGNVITSLCSPDGQNWTVITSATETMSTVANIGLAGDSGNGSMLCSSTFDNVSVMAAAPVTANLSQSGSTTVNLLASVTVPSGSTPTITSVTPGLYGTVVNNGDGTITYTASDTGLGKADILEYTVSDGLGDTATATVTFYIGGLMAYWQFNDGSGTTAADSTGNGNAGTLGGLPGSTTWTTGTIGGALALDGATGQVLVPNNPDLNFTGPVTLSAWIKTTAMPQSGAVNDIIEHGYAYGSPNGDGWYGSSASSVYLRINGNGGSFYQLGSYSPAGGTQVSVPVPAGDIGNWVQLTGVYDGTAWRLYDNGALIGSATTSVGAVMVSRGWGIGSSSWNADRLYPGSIEEARVYNEALTPAEVSALYTHTQPAPGVATNSSSSSNPVTGLSTNLSVLGSDPSGESTLCYTWAATAMPSGAPAPVFTPNGTNGAKNATVTVGAAGNYTFTVTISDSDGNLTTNSVNVTVDQTLATIAVTPVNPIVGIGGTQQLTATGYDQFSNAMTSQPTFTWTVTSGSGSVSSSGLYTAPTSASAAATVMAASGGVNGSDIMELVNVWSNTAGGSWTNSANWLNGAIPSGRGATADFNTLTLPANATVTLDGAQTVANLLFGDTASYNWILNSGSGGTLTLSGTAGTPAITVNNRTATINAVVSGTQGLVTSGSGTLVLGSANTYSGGTTLASGTLSLGNNTALSSGTLTLSGGTLLGVNIGNFANNVVVTGSATTTLQGGSGASYLLLSGSIAGSGTIQSAYDAGDNIRFSGNNSGFTGTFIVQTGGYVFLNSASSASAAAAWQLNSSSTLEAIASGTLNFGSLAGGGQIDAGSGADVFSIGALNQNTSFSGTIVNAGGTGSLIKVGAGTLTLGGVNTYTGATTVNAGTLNILGSVASSAVTVSGSGTLAGSGTTGAVTVTSGGTLAPGVSGTGSLSLNNTPLSLSGAVAMEINVSTGMATEAQGISTVTYGGTLTVTNLAGTFAGGETFTLFSAAAYSGSFSTINLPTLPADLVWNTSNLAVNGSISVAWNQTLTTIGVTPVTASLGLASTQQFTAMAYDQLGVAMASQPGFTWSSSGVGSINSSGLYTTAYTQGSATVQAASGSVNGTASVTVVDVPPIVTVPAAASPSTVSGSTTALSVSANGETALTYTWAATSMPSGATAPTYSANGTTTSNNTTATFSKAGAYTLTVTITDLGALSSTSSVNVTVNPTVTTIAMTPINPSVASGGEVQLSATASDQFGNVLSSQPTFTWAMASGGGSVSSNGLYTAPASSGTATVTASSGGINGQDTITIVPGVASGIWTNLTGGSWTGGGNWQGGSIPSGSGCTADFSTLALGANATVTLDGAQTAGNLIFGDTASYSWILNTGSSGFLVLSATSGIPTINVKNQTTTINAVIAGTQGLLKSGSGTLVLSNGTNNYSGGTALAAGTLSLGSNAALSSGTLTLSGGTLLGVGISNLANNVVVTGSTTTTLQGGSGAGYLLMSGSIAGSGTIQSALSAGDNIRFSGNNSGFTGTFIVQTGGYVFLNNANSTSAAAAWQLNPSSILEANTSGTFNLGSLAGSGQVESGVGADVYSIGALNQSGTFGGVISNNGGTGSLIKIGSGTLTLGGANTYSGATSVNTGTLNVIGSITSSAVTVNSGATLSGTGTTGAVSVGSGGTLAPGIGGTGSLSLNSNALSLSGSAAMAVNASTGANTKVQGISTATYGGALNVTNVSGTLAAGNAFTLFSATAYSGSFSALNLPSLSAGLYWNTANLAVNGSISVTGQTLTSITVSPSSETVAASGTQQFTATGYDQFGYAMVNQPAFTWTVAGVGSVNGSGLYTGSYSAGTATVQATSGTVSGSAGVTVTGNLPSGWTNGDTGSVGVPGGSSYSGTTYTVNGSGAGISGTADGFQFASETLAGDGEIRAQVTSQTNTNANAKAGVMIRTGTGGGAVNALVALTPGSGFIFQERTAVSGSTTVSGTAASYTSPNNWVRLTRSGTLISAYVSTSGTAWTEIGTAILSTTNSVSVGLAVTSASNTEIGTATFANVSVTQFPSPWLSVDIGSPGLQGSAEYYNSAYTLKGAGNIGSTADNYHYVYQSLTNSGTLSARISTFQNTGTNSRVGVMIRTSLTNNSQYAYMGVSGTGAFQSEYRSSTGGSTTTTTSGTGTQPNLWVKVGRSSNTLSMYKSSNGTSWTLVKSVSITMGTNIYVGFADASGTTTTLNTSVFDNVSYVP